ncbi:hypothetical protein C0991_012081 [Blastosporella zonata]|nr:hypothetical protein C0991_012081 [Blastosporella zonata]
MRFLNLSVAVKTFFKPGEKEAKDVKEHDAKDDISFDEPGHADKLKPSTSRIQDVGANRAGIVSTTGKIQSQREMLLEQTPEEDGSLSE